MCKGYWMVFALVCIMMLGGCSKPEFNVNINLNANVDQAYTFLYYASDKEKGWLVDNVVNLQHGKGNLQCATVNPTLVFVLTSNGQIGAVFYAEKGDEFEITGKSGNPTEWDIRGNKISEELSKWRLENSAVVMSGNTDKINAAVVKYVDAHRDSEVSLILLTMWYDRRDNEQAFVKQWEKLDKRVLESEISELCGRSDMLLRMEEGKPVKQIVLNTVATGCDTIRMGKVPVFLYFTSNNIESYRADVDSVRSLSRAYPDSATRIIADINFEPDSAARTYPVRRDSLENCVHGWMPLGVSDHTAQQLGVGRIPYMIVYSKDGREVYRGDVMREAAKAFRSAMR